MIKTNTLIIKLLVFVGIIFQLSCTTFSIRDYTELDENDLFNKAQLLQQSAITKSKYEQTIELYELYIEKFSERPDRILESKYEIGYINFYLKQYDMAEEIFIFIIKQYEDGDAAKQAPQWILVLSKKLKNNIKALRTAKILEESEKLEKKANRIKKLSQ